LPPVAHDLRKLGLRQAEGFAVRLELGGGHARPTYAR